VRRVDQGKVVGEQSHADALPPVIGMGAQQRQVEVRFVPRMRGIKPAYQLHAVAGRGAEVVGGKVGQALFLLGCQLRATGRDPDRGGLPAAGQPGIGVAQCPRHEQPPEIGVMRGLATGASQRVGP
jgi:hypothetical protein